jgi:predicted enzyme related to lactoylglutathione lyase
MEQRISVLTIGADDLNAMKNFYGQILGWTTLAENKDIAFFLAIIPGGHGQYIGEITTINTDFKENDIVVPMIEKFLDKKLKISNDRH